MAEYFRGRMLHCSNEGSGEPYGVVYYEDAVLITENGHIVDLLNAQQAFVQGVDSAQCRELGNRLLVPGFIDTHVHGYQLDMIASYGEQLLQWLERYTFPAELAMADPLLAEDVAQAFIQQLLRHGTTSAMVFATSNVESVNKLFEAALARQMCLISGKVMMDRNAPAGLCDTAESSYADSVMLIEKWHAIGRLRYAVTPRFAITSTEQQLALAGKLMEEYPNVYLQTHLAENSDEINYVKELFSDMPDYLGVYEHFGLCTERSVFAHCVHLSDSELHRIGQSGAVIACCPTSNLFLGSGLAPWGRLRESSARLSVATDVGGGTSFSMLETLRDLYKVAQVSGTSFSPFEGFYNITLGNARALGLESYIGDLSPGSEADFLILDPDVDSLMSRRISKAHSIEEEWFVYMTLGNASLVSETWVAGKQQYCASTTVAAGEHN